MRIFYAVQATGNGHIARAIELLPFLQQYGSVDVFLSGSNSNLPAALPVQYKSKGISLFYNKKGGLDYGKMVKAFQPRRVWKEARALPVDRYDLVINDFESITSLACWLKNVPCINFGHQASFQSAHTPRPASKDRMGELVLKRYAPATDYVGLHFDNYDKFIFSPVLKQSVLQATPVDKGHITVYLSHYADEIVAASLKQLPGVRFEVFSKKVKQPVTDGNITFIPINNEGFNQSMITSRGVITGAGFETPAEALYLGKRLLCLPIKGQYEQWCNAAALEQFNVPVVPSIGANFAAVVDDWLQSPLPKQLQLRQSTGEIVRHAVHKGLSLRQHEPGFTLKGLLAPEDILAVG
ncbi:glycosyltransferase family protein [Deminuibacter soli]|uniref:Glycosyl transferase n=1 Tax=Deminuibacter soli TaxID=2291815 RepID=A0A3E1NR67_9BACT|nr:glycosyltransferase family protein [Deminuibacter soli]RFM30431.1 glycosyl transferase [Deminuibacter soli]